MNYLKALSVLLVFCLSDFAAPPICNCQETESTAEDREQQKPAENEYLLKLKDRLKEQKKMLAKLTKDLEDRNTPAELRGALENACKPTEYQIELAERRIRRGQLFGKKQYDQAVAEIANQSREDSERRQKELHAAYDRASEKRARDYLKDVEKARQKAEKSRQDNDRKFQIQKNAANLEYNLKINGPASLSIWNLSPDRELHDRFTTVVNIYLNAGDKTVWSKKGVNLNRKAAENHFKLPSVLLTRW